ncbi:MAG: hypothetical protein LAP21_20180 [Acidobacteriia bacterium]|nr:hypothetical protein [Terriglobia bacterium]
MSLYTRSFFAACLLIFAFCAIAPVQSAAQTVAPSSGKALCSALTPADFTKAGIPVSGLGQANLDGNDGAYCVYKSQAGKVEFDIFFPAGANPKEVDATEKTVLGEGGCRHESLRLAGADDAQLCLAMPDLKDSSSIVVRKGKAVFDIVIPKGAKARQQLMDLAQIVLSRLKK